MTGTGTGGAHLEDEGEKRRGGNGGLGALDFREDVGELAALESSSSSSSLDKELPLMSSIIAWKKVFPI